MAPLMPAEEARALAKDARLKPLPPEEPLSPSEDNALPVPATTPEEWIATIADPAIRQAASRGEAFVRLPEMMVTHAATPEVLVRPKILLTEAGYEVSSIYEGMGGSSLLISWNLPLQEALFHVP